MGKTNTISFAVANFSEAEANAIAARVPGPGTPTEKLSTISASLLRDLAKGGVMLPPEWATRIESAIGTTEPQVIVEHVEKAVGREGDATVVQWKVDPTQVGWYKQVAESNGITLEHHLKSCLDFAYLNGHFGQNSPNPFQILLTPEQYRQLQQMLAKDVLTGADVMDLLAAPAGAFVPPAVDDFSLDEIKA